MMGMIGHAGAGPIGAWVGTKVLDHLRACLISSVGTLTHVRTIEMCVESILPQYSNDLQEQVVSFVLVRTVRSCLHIIKLPN
jgi:hypothetical protein